MNKTLKLNVFVNRTPARMPDVVYFSYPLDNRFAEKIVCQQFLRDPTPENIRKIVNAAQTEIRNHIETIEYMTPC